MDEDTSRIRVIVGYEGRRSVCARSQLSPDDHGHTMREAQLPVLADGAQSAQVVVLVAREERADLDGPLVGRPRVGEPAFRDLREGIG